MTDFDFVEKGRNVVSCSRDGTARLWDVSQQKCLHVYGENEDSLMGLPINACAVRATSHADYGETGGGGGNY